jgi:IS605 OrfB family transposase
MGSQYLTAVFELRPTRRKAAALERVRATAEAVFWQILAGAKAQADTVAQLPEAKPRRAAWHALQADLGRSGLAAGIRGRLTEPVIQGLVRDVHMAIGSYIELRAGGHAAEWPVPILARETDHAEALDQLASASTREHEAAARDALALVSRWPGPRPLTIARARDAQIVRSGPQGGIAVAINVLRASDPTTRPAKLLAGLDAVTGAALKGGTSRTKLMIPLACAKWHEQKFLSGGAVLRSSLIRRAGARWFLCAQFEFPVHAIRSTGARLGVDRGIVNPVAAAVVDRDGAVRAIVSPAGGEIGRIITKADERRRREQKRRGTTSHRHNNAVEHQLHLLANGIVAEAKQRGGQVVIEKLDGFKQVIVATRPKGERKGGWRRTLKRAQLGKLETIISYKLSMAGLAKPREVVPGGTSITCSACGYRDPKNRVSQDRFVCTSCGFAAHADSVGAVNIGRRGIAMEKITKGARLAPLEQAMIRRLHERSDCGLGPLADSMSADGFVAVRASAGSAYDPAGLTESAGQNSLAEQQSRGDQVIATEQDMVARLRSRGDGGLGPLAAKDGAASGFVAARAAAAGAYDPQGLTSAAGQNSQPTSVQNASDGVFAERNAHASAHKKGAKASVLSAGSSAIGCSGAKNAGRLQQITAEQPRRRRCSGAKNAG